MSKDFQQFLNQLSKTNATLDYFVDFDKVNKKVRKIALKLNQLDYLLGHKNIENAVKELFEENPKVFSVLNILIAIRKSAKKQVISADGVAEPVANYFSSPSQVYTFIKETGLEEVFQEKQIKSLVDYVFGVEVGLDTNARKNRGGKQMERAVEKVLSDHDVEYRREVNTNDVDLQAVSSLGNDIKRFDFMVKTRSCTYLIEANYYNSGGSKLNETARSYMDVAQKVNSIPNFEFVWVTDGQGWFKAKSKLKEAYNNIPKVYNLHSFKNFISIVKAENNAL